MIIEIKGNLLQTDCKLIAHGVNCQNVMGSGVAKALFTKYPKVKEEYHNHFNKTLKNYYPEEILGSVFFDLVDEDNGIFVAQCFTQQNYGTIKQIYINYQAITECFRTLLEFCEDHNIKELAMPKIGCGLAGGDWQIVKQLLARFFNKSEIIVKVYSL